MIFKSLLLILFVSSVNSYEKDGNILQLRDQDFPQVINEHKYIFIIFYTQWCNHCQELAPDFIDVANEFSSNNSQSTFIDQKVTFAKVQCSKNENVSALYEIEGFPKLIMFRNGQRIDYEWQRNKYYFSKWLKRITTDPLEPIDEEIYKKLEGSQQSVIVYHGKSDSEQANHMRKCAYRDYLNKYYIANLGKQQNTIEIFRPIDSTLTHDWIDQNIYLWIQNNQRPLLRKFDDKTISLIFEEKQTVICLFNALEAEWLNQIFKQSAKRYLKSGKYILFADVQKNGEHFTKFGKDFLKIDPKKIALALIEHQNGSKYVLIKEPESLTVYDIMKFLQEWQNKSLKRYEIQEQISQIEEPNDQQQIQKSQQQQSETNREQQQRQVNEL